MSIQTIYARWQMRRKTAAAWTASNEVLRQAEKGYETDTGLEKNGDGVTGWNALPYAGGGGGPGTTDLSIASRTATSLTVVSSTGDDAVVPEASITEAGLLPATDKVKLNATSGTNTGDQDVAGAITAHEAAADPHPDYTTSGEAAAAAPVQSVNGLTGDVSVLSPGAALYLSSLFF